MDDMHEIGCGACYRLEICGTLLPQLDQQLDQRNTMVYFRQVCVQSSIGCWIVQVNHF